VVIAQSEIQKFQN
jgi:hypothetical protein